MRSPARAPAATALLLALALCATACSSPAASPPDGTVGSLPGATGGPTGGPTDGSSDAPVGEAEDGRDVPASFAVRAPGPRRSILTADALITAPDTLPPSLVARVRRVDGVLATVPIGMASSSVDGRTLTVASVDPGAFRRFTPPESYRAEFVWERLAAGEVAVDSGVSGRLVSRAGTIRLGTRDDLPAMHVGAFAPLVSRGRGGPDARTVIQAAVNVRRGEQLGIPSRNALLVSTGDTVPSRLAEQLREAIGPGASLQLLALEFADARQQAVLTGTSVTQAVGTFSYTDGPDGTIVPDQSWVDAYIRTEEVPILGSVTCNKGMLPQLRGALTEIVRLGLSGSIDPTEYAGCYYPRYINRDPAYGLSLHSWGIALDLNTPGNQRGTVGEMDRRVVAVFQRWGFAWGGDWNYTDPMHFEMEQVVRPG